MTQQETKAEIDTLIDDIRKQETELGRNNLKLGNLLHRTRSQKYWTDWGFENFNNFISWVQEKSEKGRSMLYGFIGVAENLLPFVEEDTLVKMGTQKAFELKKYVKHTGTRPPDELLRKAVDSKVKPADFRAEVFGTVNPSPDEKGKYRDIRFYATDSEWMEISTALETAAKTDPIVSQSVPDWYAKKEVLLRMSREFLSTYGPMVKEVE